MEVSVNIAEYQGVSYTVIEPPDNSLGAAQTNSLMKVLAEKSEHGIHVIVFVLKYDTSSVVQFTEDSPRAYHNFIHAFARPALSHTVLALTGCGKKTGEEIQGEIHKLCSLTPENGLCAALVGLGLPPIVAFGEEHAQAIAQFFKTAHMVMELTTWEPYRNEEFENMRARRKEAEKFIVAMPTGKDRDHLMALLSKVRAGHATGEELDRKIAAKTSEIRQRVQESFRKPQPEVPLPSSGVGVESTAPFAVVGLLLVIVGACGVWKNLPPWVSTFLGGKLGRTDTNAKAKQRKKKGKKGDATS